MFTFFDIVTIAILLIRFYNLIVVLKEKEYDDIPGHILIFLAIFGMINVAQVAYHVTNAGEYSKDKIKIDHIVSPSKPLEKYKNDVYIFCEDGELIKKKKEDVKNIGEYVIPKYKYVVIWGFWKLGEVEISRELTYNPEKN